MHLGYHKQNQFSFVVPGFCLSFSLSRVVGGAHFRLLTSAELRCYFLMNAALMVIQWQHRA